MKKIFTIASIALVAALALSCRKATSEVPAKYQLTPKLEFEGPGALEFDAEGGEVCLVMKSYDPVKVTASSEWVGVEISGRYVYLSAPVNNSIYTRYSTVEITAGDKATSLQAKQPGVSSNFFWDPEYSFDYNANTLVLKFHKTDATMRITVDAQGQDWISAELGDQTLTIGISKNPYKEARESSVTWSAGKDVRTIVIKQALNPGGSDNPGDDPGDDPADGVLFSEDFEDVDNLGEWGLVDADGDGYNWNYSDQFASHSGIGILFSQSYSNDTGAALTPDNWLLAPAIDLGTDNYISVWITAQDPDWADEHIGIFISSSEPQTVSDLNSFEKLIEGTYPFDNPYEQEVLPYETSDETKNMVWQRIAVKVPAAYENKTGYIAIRHFDCTDMFYINIDDFMVTKGAPAKTTSSKVSVSSVNPVRNFVPSLDYKRR